LYVGFPRLLTIETYVEFFSALIAPLDSNEAVGPVPSPPQVKLEAYIEKQKTKTHGE